MCGMRLRQQGLSVIEILVGLAIMAVVAAASAPFLGKMAAEARVITQANTLLAALQLARGNAWRSNAPWTLCLSDGAGLCKSGRSGPARGWLVLPNAQALTGLGGVQQTAGLADLRSAMVSSDVSLHGTRLAVTYWPRSRSGTTATFTFCSTRSSIAARQIVISQTGRPRLKSIARHLVCTS